MLGPLASIPVIVLVVPLTEMLNWLLFGRSADRFSLNVTMIFSPSIEVWLELSVGVTLSWNLRTRTNPSVFGAESWEAGDPIFVGWVHQGQCLAVAMSHQ